MGEGTFTRVLRWDGSNSLEGWEMVTSSGESVEIKQSVHQMCVTRNHIIIADTAFLVEMDLLFESPIEAQAPDATLWFIRRADLISGQDTVLATSVTIPREIVHMLADFNDDDGKITIYAAHNCASDASEFLEEGDLRADNGLTVRDDLIGLPCAATDVGGLGRYVIDSDTLTLRSSDLLLDDELICWGGPALCTWHGQDTREHHGSLWWASVGFSEELRLARVEALYEDYPYRTVPLEDLPTNGRASSLTRVDTETMEIADSYAFPDGRIGLSPQFVPRKDATGETDGYIVCTMISDDDSNAESTGDEIWIFDAADLAQGPLARLGHPELNMPFTLHTAWMEHANPRTSTYNVNVQADLSEEVNQLDEAIQQMFEQDVYPHFN